MGLDWNWNWNCLSMRITKVGLEGRGGGLRCCGLLHTGSSGCVSWRFLGGRLSAMGGEGKGRAGQVECCVLCVFARSGNGFVHGALSVFVSLHTA
jgi:hypothetical protein